MDNRVFVIDKNSTLVSYRGAKRSFQIVKDGDVIAQITRWYQKNIAQVVVPGNIKHIAFKGFKGCVDLSSIRLSEGIRSVDFGTFWECKSLENLWIPHSLRHFDIHALPIEDRKITIHVRYSRGAFHNLHRAGYVLKRIDADEFENHSGLYIALKMAYRGQVALNLHICDSQDFFDEEFSLMPFECTVSFNSYAIRGKHLFQRSMPSRVVIGKDVSYIDPEAFHSKGDPYFEESNIEMISVEKGNPYFMDIDGVLFALGPKEQKLVRFPPAKICGEANIYHIPASTTTVCAGAFAGSMIETLYVPKTAILEEDSLAGTLKLDLVYRER